MSEEKKEPMCGLPEESFINENHPDRIDDNGFGDGAGNHEEWKVNRSPNLPPKGYARTATPKQAQVLKETATQTHVDLIKRGYDQGVKDATEGVAEVDLENVECEYSAEQSAEDTQHYDEQYEAQWNYEYEKAMQNRDWDSCDQLIAARPASHALHVDTLAIHKLVEPLEKDDRPLNHYSNESGVEPIDLIEAAGLDFLEGNVVKYVVRWKLKDGVADLQKAKWYLDRLINREMNK